MCTYTYLVGKSPSHHRTVESAVIHLVVAVDDDAVDARELLELIVHTLNGGCQLTTRELHQSRLLYRLREHTHLAHLSNRVENSGMAVKRLTRRCRYPQIGVEQREHLFYYHRETVHHRQHTHHRRRSYCHTQS